VRVASPGPWLPPRVGALEIVGKASAKEQYSAAVAALTAKAKLAGLWVDRAENLNGNYAISDKPLSEQEWVEKHVRKPSL
jgi:hypothetical protein